MFVLPTIILKLLAMSPFLVLAFILYVNAEKCKTVEMQTLCRIGDVVFAIIGLITFCVSSVEQATTIPY